MLKTTNLKLYRKFLILAVMIGGLFMAASINRASTEPCCWECEEPYTTCVDACYNPNQGKWDECIQAECRGPYHYCLMHCEMC